MTTKSQQRSRSSKQSSARILIVDDHPMIRERLTEVIEREPDLKVCAEEAALAERVIHAGARGYITKQEATRNILEAIRTVLDGGIYLSDKAALQVVSKVAPVGSSAQPRLSFEKLTDRELRVLELLGRGIGTRQIAETLKVSIPTIETYRARIKDKLNLRDANELLQYAIAWNSGGGNRS
jgi:DNA-binding NarL/FixJ family response regulator